MPLADASPWTQYAPPLTNAVIGNGVLVVRYKRIGTLVTEIGRFTLGSTSSITGLVTIGTAFPIVGVSDRIPLGTGMLTDASAGVIVSAVARPWTGQAVVLGGNTTSFTWAVNDSMGWNLTYECA